MTGTTSQKAGLEERFLLVAVGSVVAALPVAQVGRVHRQVAVHPVPTAAPGLAGLAEIEGEAVAVLDLGLLLGLEDRRGSDSDVVVVARHPSAGDRVGLAVDRAVDLVHVPTATVEGGRRGVVAGVAQVEGMTVQILDLAGLGPPTQ